MNPPNVEFWFDLGSNYSYLSALRIERAAESKGVSVSWRPFLLGPIFAELGWESSPLLSSERKSRYVWRDMERQSAKYGLAWKKPTTFPRSAVIPTSVAVLCADRPWVCRFCQQLMIFNFADDRDIDSEAATAEVLGELGIAPQHILAEARTPRVRAQLRSRTEEARERGVFGAPTFFSRGEMFWGNDRLEDALDWACAPELPIGLA